MSRRNSIAVIWRATQHTFRQGTISCVVWLGSELIIGLADTPGGGVAGLLVALALRLIGRLGLVGRRGITSLTRARVLRFFTQGWTRSLRF